MDRNIIISGPKRADFLAGSIGKQSIYIINRPAMFGSLFVLVSKRYEKRYLVCLSPNCQKGYRSVCHPTVRKDTGLSVTGA
jgi:hypothetical protein